jgi:hypothetical protein
MLTRLLMAVTLVAVMAGCGAPTTLMVDRTVTTPEGVVEHTIVKGEALPRNLEDLYLNWAGVVTFQIGDAEVVQPDYEVISETLLGIMCAKNPLTCKDN